jgi:hypothetical protein
VDGSSSSDVQLAGGFLARLFDHLFQLAVAPGNPSDGVSGRSVRSFLKAIHQVVWGQNGAASALL